MAEITRICDRVIFLDHGKIVSQGTPRELTKQVTTAYLQITFNTPKEDMEKYLKDQNENFSFLHSDIVVIKTEEQLIPKLIFSMSKENIYMTDIEIKKPSLEDVFIQIARGKS